VPGARTAERSTRSASLWALRSSPAPGAFQSTVEAAGSCARIRSSSDRRASVPPRRTATELTTGTPSSAASLVMSISMPRLRAMSIMLSASTTGRPTCLSSSASRSARRRLEASPTQMIRSGAVSVFNLPSTASRVISSSGERARSE
jgi:hypothetical protein